MNVAIDDLGGSASLVGLCQGGWLAAAYAARFPGKVAKLVLASAPIDPSAAESRITRALAAVPPTAVEGLVAITGGRISGALSLALWSQRMEDEYSAEAALQCAGEPPLDERFHAWNARAVDLPTTSRAHGANRSHTTTSALLSRRSTCLIACLSSRPRACASACPMTETANDAPVRIPSVPLASERIRFACKLPENVRLKKS